MQTSPETDAEEREALGAPTIKDIARQIGVSPATVSRAINGGCVSPTVKRRVQRAIELLGYQPNAIARSLKGERTHTIAVVVSDIANPFFPWWAKTIESTVGRQGYHVVVCSTEEDPQKELRSLQMLFERRVDGIVLSTNGKNNDYVRKLSATIPVVVMDHKYEDLELDLITDDAFHGAHLLARELVQNGHREIALVRGHLSSTTDNERCRGFYRALEDAGLRARDDLVFLGGLLGESALDVARGLLTQTNPPTAVFATNIMITKGILMVANEIGIRIPDDISLVGYGLEEFKTLLRPPITSIILQPAPMGTKAGEMLMQRIEKPSLKRTEVIFNPELFIGQSVKRLVG